jgi:hypothetical protein
MRVVRWTMKWLKRAAIALVVVLLLAAIPIVWNETQCVGSLPAKPSSYRPILPKDHQRNLVDTYLTYPEWSIVHAYEDFAGVLRKADESAFDYVGSIASYWRNLCSISAIASSQGTITGDVRAMLYIIGISFTGEMGIKGLYETTIGRLTEWIRGRTRTPEDTFALATAERYATFLQQTPWYEFPFGQTLKAFWSEVPMLRGSVVRSLERRFALSAEYGVKAVYAQLIAQAAALAPAALTIRSVVKDFDPSDAAGDIKLIERRADGSAVIETPRYRAFTKIMLALVERGKTFTEIAGNSEILATVLTKSEVSVSLPGGRELFQVPLQARVAWVRRGIVLPVSELGELAKQVRAAGAEFEHVYDY